MKNQQLSPRRKTKLAATAWNFLNRLKYLDLLGGLILSLISWNDLLGQGVELFQSKI
ncbi:hypothetical protein [Sphingobacterium daejeonense]|uniref:hypothetical protein n=1 Tax=Sphingobacterium daejeonense TaxID=371142 RepID=UPI001484DE29|nr:hypothetical protein [Sphingobacterium daejeonense]